MNIHWNLKMVRQTIKSQFLVRVKLIVAIFLLSSYSIAGTEDRTFERQRLELAEKIKIILIADNICKSSADCTNRKLVFASPRDSGIGIQLFAPIGKSSLLKILHECSNYFINFDRKMNLEIEMFDITKEDELSRPIWQFTKPIAIIHFIGRK